MKDWGYSPNVGAHGLRTSPKTEGRRGLKREKQTTSAEYSSKEIDSSI